MQPLHPGARPIPTRPCGPSPAPHHARLTANPPRPVGQRHSHCSCYPRGTCGPSWPARTSRSACRPERRAASGRPREPLTTTPRTASLAKIGASPRSRRERRQDNTRPARHRRETHLHPLQTTDRDRHERRREHDSTVPLDAAPSRHEHHLWPPTTAPRRTMRGTPLPTPPNNTTPFLTRRPYRARDTRPARFHIATRRLPQQSARNTNLPILRLAETTNRDEPTPRVEPTVPTRTSTHGGRPGHRRE